MEKNNENINKVIDDIEEKINELQTVQNESKNDDAKAKVQEATQKAIEYLNELLLQLKGFLNSVQENEKVKESITLIKEKAKVVSEETVKFAKDLKNDPKVNEMWDSTMSKLEKLSGKINKEVDNLKQKIRQEKLQRKL